MVSSPLTNTSGSALETVHEAGSVLNPSGAVGAQASMAFRGDGAAVVFVLVEFSKSRQLGVQPVRVIARTVSSHVAPRLGLHTTPSSLVGRPGCGADGRRDVAKFDMGPTLPVACGATDRRAAMLAQFAQPSLQRSST